ncbi:MAG: hypothetical protein WD358_01920 [Nitriliruptoraceae bacterium]
MTRQRFARRRALAVVVLVAMVAGCAGSGDGDAVEISADEPATSPESAASPDERDAGTEASDEADHSDGTVITGEAPRTDVPIYPGAVLVHEDVLAAAVNEVWAVEAPLDEVLAFYAEIPGFERLSGSAVASDDGGGYLELDLFSLVRQGETDREVYEAAVAESEHGALLRIAVVTSESQILPWFGGAAAQQAVPPGSTVILFNVLTG